ncbi:hypothetical protein VD0002_g6393 [Verticillium dahliae]|uniref:DUF7492 domain-containing protein n=4 Tax=Verticillium TaxID=1036719 RepID=G2X3B9_VERDV|nr:uncharacterized protein VDAG_04904 [Verticillium dahliae VdLs.17]KAG7100925.1 hypothetical protein HYQ44_019406 [Verticillium longisporum]KAH6708524.1 hypothetical protein EV126DRAFT_397200 [Verticillium dahliae]EGY23466.1 hypothetical protein VDAG_04904 [Verticillium dahliae VdLs.17]PNH34991.1 hypothetical protein BJF96_g1949 [Verticillium dahliae]PNH48860.1 hypothetical protein VD0003_g8277 [Verticillium dahliae]
MAFNVLLTILLLALPLSSAHSWVERLRRLDLNGTMVSDPGYIRGFVSRLDPTFNDLRMQHHLPPNGRVAEQGILPTDRICRDSQRAMQSNEMLPRLQARPGDIIALQHQENGHVTLPETSPHKEHGGTIFIYGTRVPSEDDILLSIHRVWNAEGTGGDRRGSLLAVRSFDDGQCYQINNGQISIDRQDAFRKDPADPQGADLWCQSDIRLPNKCGVYTLYWVWEWPFKPGGIERPADIYTSCMDVEILPGIQQGKVSYVDGQDLNWAGVKEQMLAG